MRVAEPVASTWNARLSLGFSSERCKTVLAEKRFEGPLVVQKPLYPEGDEVCHAIVVHPPGGIAGGDELTLEIKADPGSSALLTTPGAAKWYRSGGAWARQRLAFDVRGNLEWLPRETIVFDGALASFENAVSLGAEAHYIGWEVLCLGRTGSGERFRRGRLTTETRISRDSHLLWLERGTIEGGGALLGSPAGFAGRPVFGTLVAAAPGLSKEMLESCRETCAPAALTLLPGILLARYLGDSSEEALECLTRIWRVLRPAMLGREAVPPRIWNT